MAAPRAVSYTHLTLLQDVIPHKFKIAESVADILATQSEGKLAFVMSTQGSDCLDGDLRKISLAYKLGLRVFQSSVCSTFGL